MRRLLSLLLLGVLAAGCTAPPAASVETRTFQSLIEQLATPTMEGRGPGSAGLDRARDLVAEQLRAAGLQPAFTDGFIQTVSLRLDAERTAAIHNVAGLLPGRGSLAGETVLVAAHYDHLGRAPAEDAPGSLIHPGADDNASGTAAMLLLAGRWAPRPPQRDRRTLVFVGFSGEEHGAAGAAHLLEHRHDLAFDPDGIAAMINLDMVGRLRDGRLWVGGVDRPGWQAILEHANTHTQLVLRPTPTFAGPGDHAPFARRGIPALHLFTGLHEDYHRPTDQPWKINAAGGVRVVDFTDALLAELAHGPRVVAD